MSAPNTELEQFRQFLDEQMDNGGARLSPEEALDLFRSKHPFSEELAATRIAIQEAIAEMEAGDRGRPARDVIREARQKHGIPDA
jgi:hypothetical protein